MDRARFALRTPVLLALTSPVALGVLPLACAAGVDGASGTEGDAATASAASASGSTSGAGGASSSATSASATSGSSGAGTGGGGTGGASACGPVGGDMGPMSPACGVVLPPPVAGQAKLTLNVLQLPNNSPASGLTVKACARADTSCSQPLQTTTTNGSGIATLTLSTGQSGFDGYAEISSGQLVPELLFISTPVTKDMTFTTWVASPNTLNLVSTIYGVAIDMSRGAVAGLLSDCAQQLTGLNMWIASADGCSVLGYGQNGLPSKTATETDSTGIAYGFNIPVGDTEVRSRLSASHALVGSTTVFVRAGALSAVAFDPTP